MITIEDLKDKAIFFGWIFGFIFLISLIWILTAPVQKHYLLRTVNNAFIISGDQKRIMDYSGPQITKPGLLGYWYSIYNSQDRMFVFAVFKDGIFIPLGAIVNSSGTVNEIIPLSAHAAHVFDELPKSILQIYIKRIEGIEK